MGRKRYRVTCGMLVALFMAAAVGAYYYVYHPVPVNELFGTYSVTYDYKVKLYGATEKATENIILKNDYSYEQRIYRTPKSEAVTTTGTWTFDCRSQAVVFLNGFLLLTDGFNHLRPKHEIPVDAIVSMEAAVYLGRVRLGVSGSMPYWKKDK